MVVILMCLVEGCYEDRRDAPWMDALSAELNPQDPHDGGRERNYYKMYADLLLCIEAHVSPHIETRMSIIN